LATIGIRRLLNRGKFVTDAKGLPSIEIMRLISGTSDKYGMNFDVVCTLELALQEWYNRLSPYTKFDANINVFTFPPAIDAHPSNMSWLRIAYTSMLAVVMWPAVDITLTEIPEHVSLPDRYQKAVRKYCTSAVQLMASANKLLNNCMSPQVFQICMAYYPFTCPFNDLDYIVRVSARCWSWRIRGQQYTPREPQFNLLRIQSI